MTLTQLRYLIAVAKLNSYRAAAQSLYISQPSISKAISSLEKEMEIEIFKRTQNGVILTSEGQKFLGYARQVVEQADLLESKYRHKSAPKKIFAISSQHYSFVVNAFVSLVKECNEPLYEFSLREQRTFEIIEDVKNARSELGILYLSKFNREVILHILEQNNLDYTVIFRALPHVFISSHHPLAQKSSLTLEDLKDYPRLSYDQGLNNSFYFAEELHSTLPCKKSLVVTDRATLFNLLVGLDGYTIASGILSKKLNGSLIISIPLKSEEHMDIICINPKGQKLSLLAKRYLELLDKYVRDYHLKTQN